MKIFLTLLILAGSLFAGCSNSTGPDYTSYFDKLKDLDAIQTIALANEWRDASPYIKSHITADKVIIEFPDGRTVKKTIPDSVMYIAIAPYINNTHTCSVHYPSSCTGELAEITFKLTATDDDGTIYYNGDISTHRHGFLEIWLPKNRKVKLEFAYNSMTGEETITTDNNSRTCITTIALK